MWFSGSFLNIFIQQGPQTFLWAEMMVNCFACGKDIGVRTERRSFSGERPSESKVRVLHAWRSMVHEELLLRRTAKTSLPVMKARITSN